jgi:hypothetical protein
MAYPTQPTSSQSRAAQPVRASQPRRFIMRMVIFLVAVIAVVAVLIQPIQTAFMANPALNGLIIGALIIGILFIFRQVLMLASEINWLQTMQRREQSLTVPPTPKLLAPVAAIMGDRHGQLRLTAVSMNALLDSISSRLDESRDISRYMINLLIFLGLLGTFWGLLETVASVGDAINTLSITGGDFAGMFESLKAGLEQPLSGMGTAFSSSLFGLAGSLVLGFLELQASQAQNRFYMDVEEWLSSITRFSAGPAGLSEGDQSVPAYVQALLEQTAESLDNLQHTMSRFEESRGVGQTAIYQLSERLSSLTDQMRTEQDLLVKLVEGQLELKPVLQRLAAAQEESGLDQASRNHLRNLDVYVMRIMEEASDGRNQLIQELRSEIKLLARTIAAAAQSDRNA